MTWDLMIEEIEMGQAYRQPGVCQALAPNGEIQEGFAEVLRGVQRNGGSEREQVISLVQALLDGLQHGNWPVLR